jgi:hypothetical protein
LILIVAVIGDIWLRQNNILGRWFSRARTVDEPPGAVVEHKA